MRFIIACIKTAIEFNKAVDKYQKLYDEIDFDKYIYPFKYKEDEVSEAYRCEKCKKLFDGWSTEINTAHRDSDGKFEENIVNVCPRCYRMIIKFCKHKPRGNK